jgi:hypothetical protein
MAPWLINPIVAHQGFTMDSGLQHPGVSAAKSDESAL